MKGPDVFAGNRPMVDVLIAGGGIMGCSAAFWLSVMSSGKLRICVVEQDPTQARSSTALSVASIRQQFTTETNVKISRFGIEFIKNINDYLPTMPEPVDLGFVENGYLLLAGTRAGAEKLKAAQTLQNRLGAQTRLLDRQALKKRYAWLNVDDICCASLGLRDEGWFDNMGLLRVLRQAARENGVEFRHDRIVGLHASKGRICDVTLERAGEVRVGNLVNAMGTNARDLLAELGEELPVEPRKRTVFTIDAPEANHPDTPLMVCHSGFYLRPEGRYWLCATVPLQDGPTDPDDFEPDLDQFEQQIWPRLYARSGDFASVKVVSSWAGHYAFNRFDQNAIVGRHPAWQNFFLMTGFSGHGLQQAPAVGRAIAEQIVHGAYRSLDLSNLSIDRVYENRPYSEDHII